ncbi:hypothetical protein Acr_19g0000560 [Actinidia rufa]|uniref:Uncharacterized protein n=1 Tax=Actinidia rufa TaxID=165716 RepID=A0A7J0G8K9_9ERIC|nr:hypothetical protein Acr_19g0000560 [Actinidia rufa]
MMRELERKEAEFVTGGTQPLVVAPTPKINFPIPGVSTVATGGLHPIPASVDSVARDVRQNKKSKWDKALIYAYNKPGNVSLVDGDRRNPLHSGGQDSVSTASAHAALLTAANAGTGYTGFA